MPFSIKVDLDLKREKEEYNSRLQSLQQSGNPAFLGHPFVTADNNGQFRHFVNTDHDSVQSQL